MKNKKKLFISLFMVFVILTLTSSPVLSADIQAAYAKIPDSLLAEFNAIGNNESLNVVVWIEDESTDKYQSIVENIPEPSFDNDSDSSEPYSIQSITETADDLSEEERLAQIEEVQNYIMQKRQIAQAVYLEDNTQIANELAESGGEVVYISRYSPLVICDVTLSEAVDMAMCDSVLSLESGEGEVQNDMTISKETIGVNDLPEYSASADLSVIGVIEAGGIPDESLSCFDGIRNKMHAINDNVGVSDHATFVTAILVGKDYGIVQDFESLYYAAILYTSEFYIATEALLSAGVNVINYSGGNYDDRNTYTDAARWVDHIAYNHSVHFVKTSGNMRNGDIGVNSPGMAHNAITVGNVNDRGSNIVINPGSCYNETNNDVAYKPDLCAPGTDINFPQVGTGTGTSLAAPQVAGIVAILCSQYPVLYIKQALMKSILMSSVSIQSNHIYHTRFNSDGNINIGYRKYGSGIVNAYNAVALLSDGTYRDSSISADEDNEIYLLGPLEAGKLVTVTLTFLKRVRFASSNHSNESGDLRESMADLDLIIIPAQTYPVGAPFDKSTGTFKSITTNNCTEKVTFSVPTSGNYLICVNKHQGQDPYDVIYGLSWIIHNSSMQ